MTISGSGGSITLPSGADGFSCGGASSGIVISVPLKGSGAQVEQEGSGYLALYAANTYTGGTLLTGGQVVYYNQSGSFGTGAISDGGTASGNALVNNGSAGVTIANNFTLTDSGAVINLASGANSGSTPGANFTGTFSLPATYTLETGGSGQVTEISGAISGAATSLTVNNGGTLWLGGANTYSGPTTIAASTVLSIIGSGSLGSGNYAGAIANGGTFTYASSAGQTLSGIISGAGAFNINSGVVTLSGVNTYTGGVNINSGGTCWITADSGLGTAAGAVGLNGGCLHNNNSSPNVTSSRTITIGASGGYFDAGWTLPLTISAKITGAGPLLVNLDGGSYVVLGNTGNNYTGDTCIGTNGPNYYAPGSLAGLQLGANGVIPNGSGFGNVSISATYKGQLDLNGHTQTINGLGGDGTVNNSTGSGSLSVGNNSASSTFSGVIENTGGTLALTKVGSGTLTLSGANTYTGGTSIGAGTLSVNTIADSGTTALGPSGTLTLNGGTLSYTGTGTATTSRAVTVSSASTIDVSSGTGNLTLNGSVSGAFVVTKTSSGTLTLGGSADNVSHAVAVSGGTVVLNKTSTSTVHALGGNSSVASGATLQLSGSGGYEIYGGVTVTVASGGVFDLNSQSLSAAGITGLNLSGTGISSGGALINSAATATSTLTCSSGITLQANSSVGGAGNIILPSAIGGAFTLTKVGAGTLTFSGANTYSAGATLNAGLLNLGSSSALGTSAGAFTISGNGSFDNTTSSDLTVANAFTLSGGSPTYVGSIHNMTITGTPTISGANRTITVTANTLTLGAGVTDGGSGKSLTKAGAGTLVLSAAAGTWTGGSEVDAGTLSIGSDTALGTGTFTLHGGIIQSSGGARSIANATVLSVSSGTVAGADSFTFSSSGTFTAAGAARTLTVNNSSTTTLAGNVYLSDDNSTSGRGLTINGTGNVTISAPVANNNAGNTQSATLTYSGSGTLTLSGANTYTGATTVNTGILALGAGGSIGASATTVSSGATLANATTTTRSIGAATVLSSGAFASFTGVGGGSSAVGKTSVTGNLTLNNNVITVNVTGSALAAGSYRLLDCTGTLTGSANATPTITGTALASGYTATVSTTTGAGGHVDLVVMATPTFSGLSGSHSVAYGTATVTLGGKLSATGPVYPPSGETVTVTINGNARDNHDQRFHWRLFHQLQSLRSRLFPHRLHHHLLLRG